jgi:hypothetical protein
VHHRTPTGLGAAYHPPRLSCRILPEYARLVKDLERIFNKDQKARLKYLKKYQIEWDSAK